MMGGGGVCVVEMEGGDEGRVCDGVEMEEGRGGYACDDGSKWVVINALSRRTSLCQIRPAVPPDPYCTPPPGPGLSWTETLQ